ncbi:MAG TPA: cupin domain-containing protein [Planctomycetota bacterium]|nr:cupin domain-containing protein [Planctomycetota bacterium]
MRHLHAAASAALLLMSLLMSGCGSSRVQILMPGVDQRTIEWSEKEQQQIQAMKLLHTESGTSVHALRLAGRSDSRVHDNHDLTMIVLSGHADVRLAGKWKSVNPGDIIEVPRGSPYQLDRLGSDPAEFYFIYYPPYDGKDLRNVDKK